jgi:iron complex transport system substrate-binding protein
MYRWIKPFILMAFLFLLTTNCARPPIEKNVTLIQQPGATSECRIIQHRLGKTCVPLKSQRIIALDIPAILDPLLSLGIKPVGVTVDYWGGKRYFPAIVPEKVAGIESVGKEGSPSLEKILLLKPDLILMADYDKQYYKQLSTIAPTVLIDIYNLKADIKENFQYIAKLLGQEEKAKEVLKQYQKRIEEFQKRLGKRLKEQEVSVIGYYERNFWATPSFASPFQVLKDIGLPIKSLLLEKDDWSTFSIEVIDRYDADILFIVDSPDSPDTSTSYLSQNPLILSLQAVKNGQAYIVDPKVWTFYGPLGMNLFLDDISKYLLEGKQDPYFQKS